jgi:ribose transport system substrate-binding protein
MHCRNRALGLLISAALVSLLGCNAHSGETYIFISTNIKIPYWQTAASGFKNAAQQLEVAYSFIGPDTYDPKAELEALDNAALKKPTGILISVADPSVLSEAINRTISQGIPVITVDSDAPDSKRLFFIGTNNYQAGVSGGRRLAQELKGKGNVVVYTMLSQQNLNERLRGYHDAVETLPAIKMGHIIDIKGDPRITFDTTTQFLANDKKEHIDGFVCLEALSGKEVATVLDNNGVKGKTIVAMDADPETLQWIQKGVIAATVSQKPYTMGFIGLKMLDDIHHEKFQTYDADWAHDSFAPVPAYVDTGSAVVDKTNVNAFLAASKITSR